MQINAVFGAAPIIPFWASCAPFTEGTVMLKQLLLVPILGFLALTEPLQAIAQQTQPPNAPQAPQGYYWGGPWHMWSDGYAWPHFWIGPMMMVLFAIFFVAVMFLMMRGRMMHDRGGDRALNLLKERFARGEINQTEYEERKRVLEV